MRNLDNRPLLEVAIDMVNLVLGVCLAFAPWVLNFAGQAPAAWNAWVTGAAIFLVAVGALVFFAEWEEWANLLLGIWVAVAPWLLGFAQILNAMYVHMFVGVLVAVLAALELWVVHQRPTSRA